MLLKTLRRKFDEWKLKRERHQLENSFSYAQREALQEYHNACYFRTEAQMLNSELLADAFKYTKEGNYSEADRSMTEYREGMQSSVDGFEKAYSQCNAVGITDEQLAFLVGPEWLPSRYTIKK